MNKSNDCIHSSFTPSLSPHSPLSYPQIQRYNSDGALGNTSTQIYVDIYYTTMREMVSVDSKTKCSQNGCSALHNSLLHHLSLAPKPCTFVT